MKALILLILGVFSLTFSFSQDTIIKINGDQIKSKVISIGTKELSYKKYDNLEGPVYQILKDEIFMIKYQNGTSDILNEKKKIDKTENIKQVEEKQAATQTIAPIKPRNYMDKVRLVQAKDPGFTFFLGNGFLGGQGILSPLFGVDFRLPRKNVFVRGISVGARASFTGLSDIYDRQQYTEIYGFGLSIKYYAPLPIKVIQPYFVAILGGALRNYYVAYGKSQYPYSDGTYPWDHEVTEEIGLYTGFGVGCNFMFLNHLGGFAEFGYFTTSYINLGLTLKLGMTSRKD